MDDPDTKVIELLEEIFGSGISKETKQFLVEVVSDEVSGS